MKDTVEVVCPKPFQEVETNFVLTGWIPKSWLDVDARNNCGVSLDFIDINCFKFAGGSADAMIDWEWLLKFRKKLRFHIPIQFSQFNLPFIRASQGRITIELRSRKDDFRIFLPIIIKNVNPNFIVDPEITRKHSKIGETILRYEKELIEYDKAMGDIREKRKQKSGVSQSDEYFYCYSHDWVVARGILDIFGQGEGQEKDYPFIEEDGEEERLKIKYKDAIEWQGPFFHGTACQMDGFDFRVYSHDHDKHFHILHRERGVDARFSFPDIKLINFKNAKTSISSRDRDKLIEFIKQPENFKRLEEEFARRDQNKIS